jgi:hypothetical protein
MRSRPIAPILLALATLVARPGVAATPAELLRCQKAIHSARDHVRQAPAAALTNCTYRIRRLPARAGDRRRRRRARLAAASASCAAYSAKIPSYRAAAVAKATSACLALSAAELQQSVGGLGFGDADPACPIGTASDLVACLFDATQCAAERTIFALDPRAADALGAAGIAGAHPCAAP